MEFDKLHAYLRSLVCTRFTLTKRIVDDNCSQYTFIDRNSDKIINIVFLPIYEKCFIWASSRIMIDGINIYDMIETKSLATVKKKLKEFEMYPHIKVAEIKLK